MLSWLGLRSRLVVVVLLALLPVFGLFVYSAAKNQQVAVQLAQDRLQTEVLLAAAHQQRLVDRVAQLLGNIASVPAVRQRLQPQCTQFLASLLTRETGYVSLGVVDQAGKLVCRASPDADARLPDFSHVGAEQVFWVGHYLPGPDDGQSGLIFSAPFYGAEGALGGRVFAVLDLAVLNAELQTVQTVQGAQLRVLDRHGAVLSSHPAGALATGEQEGDAVLRQAALSRQLDAHEGVDAAGIERVYAYAPVNGAAGGELLVASSVPRHVITATPRQLLRSDLAALFGLSALGVACAWLMGRCLVVNPARAILKEAQEIARGNLQARVWLASLHQGELGQLGLAFNHMAESLQTQRSALDAALAHAEKERVLLDLILNSMGEGVIAVDNDERFLRVNASAERHCGGLLQGSKGLHDLPPLHGLLRLDGQPYVMTDWPLMQALRGRDCQACELVLRRPGFQDKVLRVSARPLLDSQARQIGALAVLNDVTALKAAEGFARAQEQVLVLMAGSAPLQASLEAIVRLVEHNSPGSLCAVLLAHRRGHCLLPGVAPSLPPAFVAAIEGLPIAEGAGACGTAAFRKEPVMVENVGTDPLMHNYLPLLREHGLQACWSTPVLASDGQVLATFALYRQAPGLPQPHELELIAAATRLARIALERARTEAALVSSEARFRELAENVQDMFYNRDLASGRYLYISPAYEALWQRSLQSLYADADSCLEAIHPDDQAAVAQSKVQHALGVMSDLEYRVLLDDGRVRWIRDHSYPVFNEAGEVERVVGTARDITERKRADLALASNNRALQMLSRTSLAINRMQDEAGLLAEVCRVAVEVGGYRMAWVGHAQDDEGKTIVPVAHAGQELGYLQAIRLSWSHEQPTGLGPAGQAVRTGQAQQTGDIRHAAPRFFWHQAALERGYLSVLALPLHNPQQRSIGVLCLYAGQAQAFAPEEIQLLQELADNLALGIGSLRAQQEQRRSQEAMRQAAARLREQASLIDLAQDAIVVSNLDRTLRFWNKGAERLYGWPAEAVLGRPMDEVMYRQPQPLAAMMEGLLASGGHWSGEIEQVARDGTAVHVEMRCTVVRDEHGRINGVMSVHTDIGERKRAREEVLRLNASLEERVRQRTAQLQFANEQLEAFSYSVSHDLRSPLSSINGFGALLEKSLMRPESAPLDERSRHYLTRIRAGAAQMGALIDSLLELAQVSRSRLSWEKVDLGHKAQTLLASFQEQEPQRLSQWQVEPGLLAQGDPQLLKQVLYNLLGNAWKFTAGQPCTRITVGRQSGSAGQTVYFVRDNGAGFDMAYAEKLFEAFQRLHALAEFPGTGIGLATVQRIIARHGGTIWAESAVGQGATFYFTLGASAA
ncbi:MAG: PAS domain S-box protein [Polaromonas sp.]